MKQQPAVLPMLSDKCVGLPTLAALKQGIPVIAVRENGNILENDLTQLPWAPGQFYQVQNYWEAAGVLAAMKQGLDPCSARQPFGGTKWDINSVGDAAKESERLAE
ncbi:DUF3326 domain-containing protein [Arenibacterium sp. CAU 1754]